MDDLISRTQAIDALDGLCDRACEYSKKQRHVMCDACHLGSAFDVLEQLPTQTNATNTLDCVERQAAIDAVEILLEQTEEDADVKTWNNAIRGAINSIKHHVPSAQPEPIRINLNEPIKVKLTDWGREIYYHQYDRTNQIAGREICKPRFPREDENGYTAFQLWCFIELYGMHMGMTLPNVIEPLEIVYEG